MMRIGAVTMTFVWFAASTSMAAQRSNAHPKSVARVSLQNLKRGRRSGAAAEQTVPVERASWANRARGTVGRVAKAGAVGALALAAMERPAYADSGDGFGIAAALGMGVFAFVALAGLIASGSSRH
jgi:hypothetical protein